MALSEPTDLVGSDLLFMPNCDITIEWHQKFSQTKSLFSGCSNAGVRFSGFIAYTSAAGQESLIDSAEIINCLETHLIRKEEKRKECFDGPCRPQTLML